RGARPPHGGAAPKSRPGPPPPPRRAAWRRQAISRRASGAARLTTSGCGGSWQDSKPSGPRALAVEERDRQAVELLVGALGDDLVDDLQLLVLVQPAGDVVAHRLAVARERGGEDLHAGEDGNAHRRTSCTICATSLSV